MLHPERDIEDALSTEDLAKWMAYFQLEPMAADRADRRDAWQRSLNYYAATTGLTHGEALEAFTMDYCPPPVELDTSQMAEGTDMEDFRRAEATRQSILNM